MLQIALNVLSISSGGAPGSGAPFNFAGWSVD
jgi:hypothetical protein